MRRFILPGLLACCLSACDRTEPEPAATVEPSIDAPAALAAVLLAVMAGLYAVYHKVTSGKGFDDDHDHADDSGIGTETRSDLEKYRRRLNKSAAEIRNEPFKRIHWRFREYLAENQVKSIRSGARTFYESLPPEEQIYQSVDHAVRNLSEALYGKRGRRE